MQMEKTTQPQLSLNVFELELLVRVLNGRSTVGCAVKDLKLIDGTISYVQSLIPASPTQPKLRELSKELVSGEPDKHTKEELAEFEAAANSWGKEFEAYLESPIACNLSSVQHLIVKQKLQSFNGFQSDEQNRSRILKMIQKFGL
jgi:hypothetical protein